MSEDRTGPKPAKIDSTQCPECGSCIDLAPLLLARDLAIVSALLQELGMEDPPSLKRRVDRLVKRLSVLSVDLCTDLGFYGYDYLGQDDPEDEAGQVKR